MTTEPATAGRPLLTLRNSLLIDAVLTTVNGLVFVAGAAALDDALGPSTVVMVGLGVFMLAYAAFVAWLAGRRPVSRLSVALVADGNFTWAIVSVAVVAYGWLGLTTAGVVWTIVQAGLVAGFAIIQILAVRRAV
ncbi:MAG: hypothetical protein WAL70_03365 [Aeromicrobium sp.]